MIISEELWDKVQSMISQKKEKPSCIYDGEYTLTEILKCPECGAGMVISRVVSRVNREHEIIKANAKKEKMIQTKETEKIQNRQTKNFESYEDVLISKEEFLERKAEFNKQLEQIKERSMETAMTLITEEKKEIPEEIIKSILQNFGTLLSSNIDRTIRKRLLHMLITEVAIDKDRNIDSIKLKLTDELIRFLQNNGGTPPDGVPSVFLFRE